MIYLYFCTGSVCPPIVIYISGRPPIIMAQHSFVAIFREQGCGDIFNLCTSTYYDDYSASSSQWLQLIRCLVYNLLFSKLQSQGYSPK